MLLTIMLSTIFTFSTTMPPPQGAVLVTKSKPKTGAAVRKVLEAQRDAWNRGDLEGYMNGYARSTETVFISGNNLMRGWRTVLDYYKKSYNSRERMGTLTFSDIEISTIGNNAALVFGRWHLERVSDQPQGRFTLLFRRTNQGWKIVHDHTSS